MNLLPVYNYIVVSNLLCLVAPAKLTKSDSLNHLSQKIFQGCAWGMLTLGAEFLWTASNYKGDYCYIQMIQPRNPLLYILGAAPLALSLVSRAAASSTQRESVEYLDKKLDRIILNTTKVAACCLLLRTSFYRQVYDRTPMSSNLAIRMSLAFATELGALLSLLPSFRSP